MSWKVAFGRVGAFWAHIILRDSSIWQKALNLVLLMVVDDSCERGGQVQCAFGPMPRPPLTCKPAPAGAKSRLERKRDVAEASWNLALRRLVPRTR